jgi:hypothetical protein
LDLGTAGLIQDSRSVTEKVNLYLGFNMQQI